jgi:FdhE protein
VAGFLHKLFAGSGSPSALQAEIEAARADLAKLGEQKPTIADLTAFLAAILPEVCTDVVKESPPSLTAEQVHARLSSDVPILRGESLALDVKAFQRRWRHICRALVKRAGEEAADAIGKALGRERLAPSELVGYLLAGDRDALIQRAEQLGLDAGQVRIVLRLTMFPVLTSCNHELKPPRSGVRWERGYCPTCGSWPLLGEYRGLEQTCHLRCGLCAAEWEFSRLVCPFCENHDHQRLAYFQVEGDDKSRAATCDECRGYIKMVTTLTPLSAPQLLVADLATLHLDLAAAERSFLPPG